MEQTEAGPLDARRYGYTDALVAVMEVMIGHQMMRTVVVVGAAKPTRLKLHHFGLFGVGEACIIWTRVHVQSVRAMLAWPKITMAIYARDALHSNLIRNSIDQVGRILRPTGFTSITFEGLYRIGNWSTQAYYHNALSYPGICLKRKA